MPRMGLLTSSDSSNSSGWNRTLGRFSNVLSILFFAGGVGYFAMNIWPSFSRDTYISEHALLPGVADENFNLGSFMTEKLRELESIVAKREGNKKDEIPYEYLQKEFLRVRSEAYVQNFTVRYPLGISPEYSGRNVFGVVRAARGASNEAIVIAAPYNRRMLPAVALLLSLARFCVDQVYWSKDLFFVITERQEIGMQAWLNGYHGRENNEFLIADGMSMHSGPIQAGLCLEMSATSGLTSTEISYNMINGQLPNLDLVNVAVRLAEKHVMRPTIYGIKENYISYSWEGYSRLMKTAVRGILQQALGPKSGLHQVFGQFSIEAVTMYPKTGSHGNAGDIHNVAKMMEGLLRCINNLLERFHQSFFFYLLLSPYRYMSIGIYMPAIGAMLLALLIKASALWLRLVSEEEEDQKKDEKEESESNRKDDDKSSSSKDEDETSRKKNSKKGQRSDPSAVDAEKAQKKKNCSVWSIAPYFISAHVFGIFLRLIPDYGHSLLQQRQISMVQMEHIFLVALVVVLYSLCFPMVMKKLYKLSGASDNLSSDLFYCLCLLEAALVLGSISVVNFGLGLILCVAWVFVFLISGPGKWWLKPVKTLLLFLVNPLMLLYLGHFVGHIDKWYELDYIKATAKETMDTIMAMLVGGHLHGNWLFTIFTAVLYPVWMLFWTLLHF